MKAVILCAGYATRLYPLTVNKPKALLPIKNRLLLDYTVERISKYVDEIIVISNSKFYRSFVGWRKKYKNIRVLNDGTDSNENRLGGIGDLWLAIKKEEINEDLLVVLGDNLFDFDLKEYIETFNKNKKTLIGLYELDLPEIRKMSEVKISDGKIVNFEEKPKNPETGMASIGIYIFSKSDLAELEDYMKTDKPKDGPGYFVKYLCSIQDVYPHIFKGKWYDIGSIETYKEVNNSWEN